jgi:Mrp family chromosome partitioning ATPase
VTRRLPSALAPTDINPSLVMLQDNQSPAAEAFRVLRTNIQFAAVAHPVKSLVVSSALPSEGKSLITANLAIAAAQAGNRVVIMDCDLHRPRQHHIFRLGPRAQVAGDLRARRQRDPIAEWQDAHSTARTLLQHTPASTR